MKKVMQIIISIPVTLPLLVVVKIIECLEFTTEKYKDYIYTPYGNFLKKLPWLKNNTVNKKE